MKIKFLKKLCLCLALLFIMLSANAQCITSTLLSNAHSNTAHSITINNPIGPNSLPLYPPLGTYTLTVKYLDYDNLPAITYITQTSTVAQVTTTGPSQFVVTDATTNTSFPTLFTGNFDFPTPGMKGNVWLDGPGGSYAWVWDSDQLSNLNCIPLPVTLTSFTSTTSNVAAGYLKLTWVTAQEFNTSHFVVQRSTDGISWSAHGVEPAAGNSSVQLTYNFYTPLANTGVRYYYRLQMVDIDNHFTYSSIIVSKGSGIGNPTNFCNYTNIEGPSSTCSSTNIFKVHNTVPSVVWSTNSGSLSISNGGTVATLTGCISGSATLTASSAGCAKTKILTGCSAGTISGPDVFCTTASYSLLNPPAGTAITWSANPTGIVNIDCTNCNPITLTRIGDGQTTLTASIASCSGTPVTVSKVITVGNSYSQLTGTYSTSTSTKPLMTVNFVPVGSIYAQFQWPGITNISSALASGSPSGTGFYSYGNMFSFNIAAYQGISVNITGTGACGQVTATRTFVQSSYSFLLSASPNPANNNINVSITKVIDTSSAALLNAQQLSLSKKSAGITRMYLYDFYTNVMIKQWTYQETEATNYNLNIPEVKNGVYLLKMERDNKATTTKIIVE